MCTLTRAERFKDARTVHNIHGKQTMNAVQEATGVSASLIADLESDERSRKVNYMDVAKLAKHYGVTSDWLLGLSEDHHIQPCASDDLGLSEENLYFLKAMNDLKKLSDRIYYCTSESEKTELQKEREPIYDTLEKSLVMDKSKHRQNHNDLEFYTHYGIGLIDRLISATRKYHKEMFWDYHYLMEKNRLECDWDVFCIDVYDYIRFKSSEIARSINKYFVETFFKDEGEKEEW